MPRSSLSRARNGLVVWQVEAVRCRRRSFSTKPRLQQSESAAHSKQSAAHGSRSEPDSSRSASHSTHSADDLLHSVADSRRSAAHSTQSVFHRSRSSFHSSRRTCHRPNLSDDPSTRTAGVNHRERLSHWRPLLG